MPFFFFFPSKAFYVWSLPVWCLPFFGRFLLFCFFSLFADYELQTITCVVSSVTRFIADRALGNRPGQTVQEAEKHPQIAHLSAGCQLDRISEKGEFGLTKSPVVVVVGRPNLSRHARQNQESPPPLGGNIIFVSLVMLFCLLGFVNRLFVHEIIVLLRK